MASDDGDHTSFQCLVMVRLFLAAVVSVLAVVVVVMVIVVVHRPEDISLSIGGGYVQTEQVWWKEFVRQEEVDVSPRSTGVTQIDHDPAIIPDVGVGTGVGAGVGTGVLPRNTGYGHNMPARGDAMEMTVSASQSQSGLGVGAQSGLGARHRHVRPGHAATAQGKILVSVRWFERAKDPVTLQVTWSAHNPSGRGPVNCNVTAIRVMDMPANASSTGKELGRMLSVEYPLRFSVPPQTSHTEKQWVTINDSDSLQYLFDRYQGKNSFRAMVQVSTTITSKARLSWATGHSVDHYCGPVNVVYGTPDDRPYGRVTCNMQSSTAAYSQAPAPAPAPAPTG